MTDQDPRVPASPESYHASNHLFEFESCRRCQRARAICRSKRAYDGWKAAQDAADDLNAKERYESPVVRYLCRWCLSWHLTTARSKYRLKRVERARRKWLVKERTS